MPDADSELKRQFRKRLFSEVARRGGDLWWAYDLDGTLQIQNRAGAVVPVFYIDFARTMVCGSLTDLELGLRVSEGARELSDVILERIGSDASHTVVEKTCSVAVDSTRVAVRWSGFAYTDDKIGPIRP